MDGILCYILIPLHLASQNLPHHHPTYHAQGPCKVRPCGLIEGLSHVVDIRQFHRIRCHIIHGDGIRLLPYLCLHFRDEGSYVHGLRCREGNDGAESQSN